MCSTSSRASATAISVSDASAATWRTSAVSGSVRAGSPSMSTVPIRSSPAAIGTSAASPRGIRAGRSEERSAA